ncbi:MAG: hypothetical protein CFE29_23980 [Bradyrhizobiaceae bacterium PARB1]|jgi:hypothetical protein|nr:MAG: hypothetical protein CFE29_23980 [Bradyrhizobiaceae bacterium PARB1]
MTFSEFDLQRNENVQLALARAFDAAWDPFIAYEGEAADTDDNRRRLAARIVALARSGQTDENELGEAGLIYLRVLTEASRLSERIREMPSPELVPNDAEHRPFGHDAVEAMSSALDLCIEELPLSIPADAVQVLSSSIVDEAARGERDPERLHFHAMATLMSRQ